MSTEQQPEALRLAEELVAPIHGFKEPTMLEVESAAELRRLHAENDTLKRELEKYNALPQTVEGSKIDLRKMREAALHAQVHGYLFKASGSEVRQVIDLLFEKSRELEAEKYELVKESARTAAEKRRADQMSLQHSMQAALNKDAREKLARYVGNEIACQSKKVGV